VTADADVKAKHMDTAQAGKEKVSEEKVAPVAITETEDVTPISREEILEILSREMPLEKASIIDTFMSRSGIVNQEVPSIYSSYFFRKDILKEFQRNVVNSISTASK
jgi:hypothetical protein